MVSAFELQDLRQRRVAELLRERNKRARAFPMSLPQRGIWFIEQLHPHTAAYHVPLTLGLDPRYDADVVRRAVAEVVAHHPSLRSTFGVDGLTFEPVQRVHARMEVPVAHTDLRRLSPYRADAAAAALGRRHATTPFDLERGPLIRAHLLDLRGDRQRLLVTVHHLVADGWSLHLLIRDLHTALDAAAHQRPAALRRPPCDYHDWSAWQRERPDEYWRPHLAFYRDMLRDAPPQLNLPTDRPRPVTPTHRAGRHEWTISPATLASLHTRARSAGTTLYAVMLAALAVVLHRRSGQEQVVIGTPMANRTHPALQEVVGYFVNIGVVAATVPAPETSLLDQVHRLMIGMLSFQDLPFEKLVEALAPRRSLAVHPIFQVMLALQNTPDAWGTERLQESTGAAKFDLTFNAVEAPDGLRMDCVYATDLFDAPTVAALCDEFTRELA